jgi:hypothetical protein
VPDAFAEVYDSMNSPASYAERIFPGNFRHLLAAEKHNPFEAMELFRETKEECPVARLLLAEILIRRGATAENELRDYLTVPGVENSATYRNAKSLALPLNTKEISCPRKSCICHS